jgi:hypothetical protein
MPNCLRVRRWSGGVREQRFHRACGFRAERGDAGVQGGFDGIRGFARCAQQARRRHEGLVEIDVRGATAVQRVEAAHADAERGGVDR